jgi:flagellar hook-associated protein 1 FlgK
MSTGFFNSGLSGLSAARLGLLTTEHNIANANTPGFSRQRTIQTANPGSLTGSGYIGQGAQVSTVERMYSNVLAGQVNQAQTTMSELDAYSAQITQIDNMLADPSAGLSPALQDFFRGVQDLAANPSQLPARQATVSTAQSLASRFQTMEARLTEINDGVNGQITSTVSSINAYAQQIVTINEQIVIAQGAANQPPNDLLDQRGQLVAELNKLVKVSTTANTDGTLNVFVGSGQALVVGSQAMALTSSPSATDPSKMVVGLHTYGGDQELPESLITGGSLGGLLNFRSESLDRVANDLGRNAASLALTFNAQNALGQDLLGNIAGDANFAASFFDTSLLKPTVNASTNNPAGSPTVTASFIVPTPYNGNFYTDLTGSDYQLSGTAGGVTLTRLSDNKQWSAADVGAINTLLADGDAGPPLVQPDPQGFSLAPLGSLVPGASYLIQPTREAARNISVNAAVAADPRLIAAAAPIRTQPAVANTGGATITAGSVATGYVAPAAGAPVNLVFKGNQLTGFPAGPVSVTNGATTTNYTYPAPDTFIPYTSGATITFSGISFAISGAPNYGDTFSIARNSSGVADGRNALALGQLQTQNTMSGKTASYQSAYAQLVSDTGNKTRVAQVRGDAQQSLLAQSQSTRDSLSGVNLDEEAANLIRYQQAYQAAAKVIDVGSKLFDTLLSMG